MGLSTDKGLLHAKRCFQIRAEKKNKKKHLMLYIRGELV
jgi:hypothetical protein